MWSVAILSNTAVSIVYKHDDTHSLRIDFRARPPSFVQIKELEKIVLTDAQPTTITLVDNTNINEKPELVHIPEGYRYGNLLVLKNTLFCIPLKYFIDFPSIETPDKPVLLLTKPNRESIVFKY